MQVPGGYSTGLGRQHADGAETLKCFVWKAMFML
jgi:hypothetical protein